MTLTADTTQITNGGAFNSGAAEIVSGIGTGGPHTLNIDTRDPALVNAGNVILGQFGNNVGTDDFVAGVNINADGTGTDGTLTLKNNILLDHGAAPSDFIFAGGNVIVSVPSVTIDTVQTAGQNAGSITFGTSSIGASVAGASLILDTGATAGGNGGNVLLGDVIDLDGVGAAFQRLQSLVVKTTGATAGTLTLDDGDGAATSTLIQVENNVDFSGVDTVILADNVQIDTNPNGVSVNPGDDGDVVFNAAGLLRDDAAGQTRNLTITVNDATAGGGTDGDVVLPGTIGDPVGGGGTDQIGVLSVTADTGRITLGASGATYYTSGITYGSIVTLTADTTQITNGGAFNSGAAEIVSGIGTGGPHTLNIDTRDPALVNAGNVILGQFGNNVGTDDFVAGVNINADGTGTDGTLTLKNNILLDHGAAPSDFIFAGGDVILSPILPASSITIDTEQGNTANEAAGQVSFGKSTVKPDGTAGLDLIIDTSTIGASPTANGGNVTLAKLFKDGTGKFVNQVKINTASKNGTPGTLTLQNDIFLDDDGAGTAALFQLTGDGNVIVAAPSVTIDTEDGGNANGGNIDLGGGTVFGDAVNRQLTLDARGATNGGRIDFQLVDKGSGQFLGAFTARTNGTGLISLDANITVDNSADILSLPVAGVTLSGRVQVDAPSIATPIQIVTQDGLNNNNSGFVDLSGATVFAKDVGDDLTISTQTDLGRIAGDVKLGLFNDDSAAAKFIQQLHILAGKGTGAGTAGNLLLFGEKISLDDDGTGLATAPASFKFEGDGNVIVAAPSVKIDTEQPDVANAVGGEINLGEGTIFGDAINRQLILDATGQTNGGNIDFGLVDKGSGQFLGAFTARTNGTGLIGLDRNVTVDNATDALLVGVAGVTFSGRVQVDAPTPVVPIQIATQDGLNDNNSGFVDLSDATVFAKDVGDDLVINTQTDLGRNAGDVKLGVFNNDATANFIHRLDIQAGNGGGGALAVICLCLATRFCSTTTEPVELPRQPRSHSKATAT